MIYTRPCLPENRVDQHEIENDDEESRGGGNKNYEDQPQDHDLD